MSSLSQKLIDALEARHQAVIKAEQEALKALEAGDNATYKQKMHDKAQLLANMENDFEPLLAELPEELEDAYDFIQQGLMQFSGSAKMSLRINSVFFMSALLYPEDHVPGTPDNLRLWLDKVRNYKA